jgi:hypothetical protein
MDVGSNQEWEKAMENASEAMIQALNTYGPSETLDLLVRFSDSDPIMGQLLLRFPTIVALGEFFSRIRVYKDSKSKIRRRLTNGAKRKHSVRCKGAMKCVLSERVAAETSTDT